MTHEYPNSRDKAVLLGQTQVDPPDLRLHVCKLKNPGQLTIKRCCREPLETLRNEGQGGGECQQGCLRRRGLGETMQTNRSGAITRWAGVKCEGAVGVERGVTWGRKRQCCDSLVTKGAGI